MRRTKPPNALLPPWAVLHSITTAATRPQASQVRLTLGAIPTPDPPLLNAVRCMQLSAAKVLALFMLSISSFARAAGTKADLVRYDFAEERVVDLSVVKKITGKKKIVFVSVPKYTEFLEGFIRGMVVDYSENPV